MVEVFSIGKDTLTPLLGSPATVQGTARDLVAFTGNSEVYLYVCSSDSPRAIFTYRMVRNGLEPVRALDLTKLGAEKPGYDAVVAPRGFLYVMDLTAGVFAFSLDAGTGDLTPIKGSPFQTGTTSTAMCTARGGKLLYVAVSPLGGRSGIACFRVASDGGLTSIGRASAPADVMDLRTDCSGKILYAASASDDCIAAYEIEPAGTLKRVGTTPGGGGKATPAGLWVR